MAYQLMADTSPNAAPNLLRADSAFTRKPSNAQVQKPFHPWRLDHRLFGFGRGGTAKVEGVPRLLETFAIMGLPAWFGYFIGACELAGAVGLFIWVLMMGALFFQVVVA